MEWRRSSDAHEFLGVRVSPHDDRDPSEATLCRPLLAKDVTSVAKEKYFVILT